MQVETVPEISRVASRGNRLTRDRWQVVRGRHNQVNSPVTAPRDLRNRSRYAERLAKNEPTGGADWKKNPSPHL